MKPLCAPAADLTTLQHARYARQMTLDGFGEDGQRRLLGAKVLVIGAGGLGSPSLLYLAAAGVGTIGVVDDDAVDLSNLHRQVIHGTDRLGVPKVDSAAEHIAAINPDVRVKLHRERLTEANAAEIIGGYDVVLDGTDNFATRYLVDRVCSELSVPEVWGSILRWSAQVSVFWTGQRAAAYGVDVCLRDVFPSPPPPGTTPNCGEAGVIGPLCGQVGSIMATEAIKLITGIGVPLIGRILVLDALTNEADIIPVSANPTRPEPLHASDLTEVCMTTPTNDPNEVSIQDFAEAVESGATVLDVREPYEVEICAIDGSIRIPLGEVLGDPAAVAAGLPEGPVYVHCLAGARSAKAAEALRAKGVRAINVEGGMKAWWAQIDPEMPRY